MCTPLEGLSAFHVPAEEEDTADYRQWKHLSLVTDQGSDMLSASYALLYKPDLKLNCSVYFDPSHGANRDFWLAVGDHSLLNFTMLMMIVMNLPHGPDETDVRYQQTKSTMTQHYNIASPATSPIFRMLSSEMIQENQLEKPDGMTELEALWAWLKQENLNRKKGYKVNKGRFMAVVHQGLELVRKWNTNLFEITVPSIELDFLQNKAMPKIKLASTGADELSNLSSTSSKRIDTGDRTLRTCGVNAMVISLAMLADESHRRVLGTICGLAEKTMDWHGHASRELRSVEKSQDWLLKQVQGDCCHSAFDVVSLLDNDDFLRLSGFLPSNPAVAATYRTDDVPLEDEYAGLAGGFAMSLLRCRLRRTLWMSMCFPQRMVLVLGTDEECKSVVAEFKKAYDVWIELKRVSRPSASVREYLERSSFQLLANKQLVRCLQDHGWKPK